MSSSKFFGSLKAKHSSSISIISFLVFTFHLFITSCQGTKLNDYEENLLGAWQKDWSLTKQYLSDIGSKDTSHVNFVMKHQKSIVYEFKPDRTYRVVVVSAVRTKEVNGIWKIRNDTLTIEDIPAQRSPLTGKELDPVSKFRIISNENGLLKLRSYGTGDALPADTPFFFRKSVSQQ